jgi:hypothetical protein
MKPAFVYLVFIGMIACITCNLLWLFLGLNTYYLGVAFLIMCCAISINSAVSGSLKWVSETFIVYSISNMLDEILFDPSKVSINEYIAAATILIYHLCKHGTKRLPKDSKNS